MIKSYTVVITEVDDIEDAVNQAKEKISLVKLLKNTMGIVTVHPDFIESGVYSEVIQVFDFPVAGVTSALQSANGEIGTYLFSVLILTSDDCDFSGGCSDIMPMKGETEEITSKCYRELRSKISGDVKLTLLFVPIMDYHYTAEYINVLSELDPAVPIFGTVANDESYSVADRVSKTFYNGNDYHDRLVMVLISGDISPKFYINSFTDEAIAFPQIGRITAAEKNSIQSINNVDPVDFFEKYGFDLNNKKNMGLLSSSFILDVKDDEDKSIAVISRTPFFAENGAIFCGGYIFPDSVLSIAFSTSEMVIETANEVIGRIKNSPKGGTVLIYSCGGRRFSLLNESMKELETIANGMPDSFNYVAGYSSGEICPALVTDTKAYNYEHNQTLIACVF